MKNNKGFAQITIIVIVVLATTMLLGGIYFGITSYKEYQGAHLEKERAAQDLMLQQQRALEEAKQEIERLRVETAESKANQESLEKKVEATQQQISAQSSQNKNITISALDVARYLSGVVEVSCDKSEGSGSLWNLAGVGRIVLTNKHVIGNNTTKPCLVSNDGFGLYLLDPSKPHWQILNNSLDVAAYSMQDFKQSSSSVKMTLVSELNYEIASLKKCPQKMSVGSPVVLIGFPAFSETTFSVPGFGTGRQTTQTVTNGVLSAYDNSVVKPVGRLSHPNYFVSAKIDSGNSGGIALAKDSNGLCVLGIPTWVSIGQYETQGIIQNIHNLFL